MHIFFCVEHKGKTLHLLKQASKPVPQERKRMKRTIYTDEAGNFEEAVVTMPNKYGYGGAHQPNIIGNRESLMGSGSAFANTSKIADPN
jgi:hypothetical protein